jgi:hypothetical protein
MDDAVTDADKEYYKCCFLVYRRKAYEVPDNGDWDNVKKAGEDGVRVKVLDLLFEKEFVDDVNDCVT